LNVAISKEIDEALDTGQESIRAVESIISALNKASDWGDWTPERKAKYAKQRAMDDAIKLLPIARHRLNLFVKEMADLGENAIQIKLNPIQFNSFTDFFFDNLISDWIVQKKIVSTRNDLMRTLSYIKRLVMTLNREAQLIQKEQISLQHQKENILLK
jgi:prefoldin subunit 5